MASNPSAPEFASLLKKSLALEHPYPWRQNPQAATVSATLALFAEGENEMELLLTRRSDQLESHRGQIAFPGGMKDPGDDLAPDAAVATALRETFEEVGILPTQVQVVGKLPSLFTLTGFSITPVVGVLSIPKRELELRVNSQEVAEVFWAGVSILLARETYREESFSRGEKAYPIDVFYLGGHRVWGATGSMIRNLVERLRLASSAL